MHPRVVLALSLLAARPQPDIDVALRDGRVVVRTVAAPLEEVLARFAQATGTEIVYEAARPRQPVSVVIEAASPAEAITQLLEGQGLNYALRLDPAGRNVEMLVITGASTPPKASEAASRASRSSPLALREPEDRDEAEPGMADPSFAPDVPEILNPSAPPGTSATDAVNPALGAGWPGGVAPGIPPGQESSNQETSAGVPAPEPGQPQPPGAASYPRQAPVVTPPPSPPVHPGPVSYP
jgi:hypothetical protein